jgi:hypothetical protein
MTLEEMIQWLKDLILGKPDGFDEIQQEDDEEQAGKTEPEET